MRLTAEKKMLLQAGCVIPAHPLALTEGRTLDEERQRQLTRYYMAAGAGGVAVGVHTTQFAIRNPEVALYDDVLRMAAEEIERAKLTRPFLKIAGICGATTSAVREAETAINHGYDLGLLSMGGLDNLTEGQLLERTAAVAQVIPVFGFYLQPSVGGRVFTYDFWCRFVEIPGVLAIKVAAFNRYQTLDVVRAVCHSSRGHEIALYTGNDDNIVADLLTTYTFDVDGKTVKKTFVGGLLGHWAAWTHAAVGLFEEIRACKSNAGVEVSALLEKGIHVTDMNAAIFDAANGFHGCIAGIHGVLYRQGLLAGIWCLDPNETLSPGQLKEIDRVCQSYPHLTDDTFVQKFLDGTPAKKKSNIW